MPSEEMTFSWSPHGGVTEALYNLGALVAVGIAVASVVANPRPLLLLLAVAIGIGWVAGRAEFGVWLIALLTVIETVGPLSFSLTKAAKLGLTAVVVGALLLRTAERTSSPEDPYRWPLGLLLATAFIATLISASPLSSMLGLASLLAFVLYYTAVRRSRVLLQGGPQLLKTVLWTAIPTAVLCLVQLSQGYKGLLASKEQLSSEAAGELNTIWPGIERASALFNGPSACGAFLGVAAVIAVTHAAVFRKSRFGYAVGSAVCLSGVFATFSRGALLGFFAGVTFSSWSMGFLNRRRMLAVGFSFVAIFATLFGIDEVKAYLRLGSALADVSPSRIDAWQSAVVVIRRFPVFGIGFYQFQDLSRGIAGVVDTAQHPHNGFLKATVEQGPIGGCAYLLFVVIFLRTSRRSLRRASGPEQNWILGSIAGAGAALFTQELFDANLTSGGSSIAILFAAMLGLQTSLIDGDAVESDQQGAYSPARGSAPA